MKKIKNWFKKVHRNHLSRVNNEELDITKKGCGRFINLWCGWCGLTFEYVFKRPSPRVLCNDCKRKVISNLNKEIELLKQKALSNLSPTSQTKSSKEDFPNGEHNISLKDNSNELSQISSNDETSLNNNIPRLRPNSKICSLAGGNHYE